jgi:hypothetical protein
MLFAEILKNHLQPKDKA